MRTLIVLVLALSVAACTRPTRELRNTQPEDVPIPALEPGPDPADIVSGVGTIRYVDLEGGFYGLVADDSSRYDPLNLEARFEEDGLRVRFRGVLQRDVMTTRQWGQPLQVSEMLELDL